MTENESDKKKVKDLTGGAYQPTEQLKVLPDGTVVRLEDPTTPKTKEALEAEKESHERAQNEDTSE